ncbi:MAG: magnesium-protoporphyrin IX monomethyl ester anaerobic oxidative cyclase [Pseudomonadota bacterium]
MRIVLINPPHESIGSRMPGEMLPPLGLLAIGGPLIDDGHHVTLIDGDVDNLPLDTIIARAVALDPDALLIGHNGSTSAHPTVEQLVAKAARAMPTAWIIYGGIFPTYHWREVLDVCPAIDIIVRGEGEETARRLMRALATGRPVDLRTINGLAFRKDGTPTVTAPAAMIADLDAYRVAWELIDHARYSYYGGKRGVVIQFSRGCPHQCSYCGQRGYWTRWRHRDPVKLAAEIGRLHREHGVTMISFADENPTTSKKQWRRLLEAIIAERVDVTMIATLRADDIVRDADILPLYRQAGFERFLIGIEHTDALTLEKVRKGGATATDRQAITLLRQAGILSLMSWVVGFADEREADYWRAYRQLLLYDPDQIITLHVTPHRWTPFFREAKDRKVLQADVRRWDYKHQVLANPRVPAWRTFLWIKVIEVLMQARPKALQRTYLHADPKLRHGMRWYARIGRRVWLHEIAAFLWRDQHIPDGAAPTLATFWGAPQDHEEEALSRKRLEPSTRAKRRAA